MKKMFIAFLCIAASSACSESSTRTQRDSESHTQEYKTYRWVSPDDARLLSLQDPKTNQPVNHWIRVSQKPDVEQKVRSILEEDLQKLGYTAQTNGKPDFFVTFYSPAKEGGWISSWTGDTLAFQGAPLVMFPQYDMHQALQYREGMAFIVIYDAASKRPVWNGTIINAISGGKANEPHVRASADQLLTNFKKEA